MHTYANGSVRGVRIVLGKEGVLDLCCGSIRLTSYAGREQYVTLPSVTFNTADGKAVTVQDGFITHIRES